MASNFAIVIAASDDGLEGIAKHCISCFSQNTAGTLTSWGMETPSHPELVPEGNECADHGQTSAATRR